MPTFAELDQLTSKELHDRAVSRAERHVDVKFFWRLLQTIPSARAGEGDVEEADVDVQSAAATVWEALRSDEGELAEGLRPLYIEYLLAHPDA